VTNLPDWLVERVALDEVAAANRQRVERADATELAARVAALHADNTAELAAYPAAPAVAQIEARIAAARKQSRRRLIGLASVVSAAATVILVLALSRATTTTTRVDEEEITRVKGSTRLLAFRLIEDRVEKLEQDALVRAGDLIQLRYNGGGQRYGVIASVDGSGVVTLHHPLREDATPEETALAPKTTALPNAYALDDAPRFERFFFITADEPIDVAESLAAVRALGDGAASASLELPAHVRQWSLRLRKPNHKATP
jgi:hypothetical protein